MTQLAQMHSSAFGGATQAESELVVLVDQYSHVAAEFLAKCFPRRFVCLPMIGPDGYGPSSMKSGLVTSKIQRSTIPIGVGYSRGASPVARSSWLSRSLAR